MIQPKKNNKIYFYPFQIFLLDNMYSQNIKDSVKRNLSPKKKQHNGKTQGLKKTTT